MRPILSFCDCHLYAFLGKVFNILPIFNLAFIFVFKLTSLRVLLCSACHPFTRGDLQILSPNLGLVL